VKESRPGDSGALGVEPPRDAAQSFERDVLEHVHLQVCSGHCLPLAIRGWFVPFRFLVLTGCLLGAS